MSGVSDQLLAFMEFTTGSAPTGRTPLTVSAGELSEQELIDFWAEDFFDDAPGRARGRRRGEARPISCSRISR